MRSPHIAPGSLIGPYRIDAILGEGGMGVVYRAVDTKLDRIVAIKVLYDDVGRDARTRFEREARMVSSLNHPHILTVHDAGEADGRQFLVTEFVDGGTLSEWIAREKPAWRQTIELLTGVADGLATAHGANILHRDIKPANILVAKNGYAKLADFGLAKIDDSAQSDASATRAVPAAVTRAGFVVGTIAYMSPEQASGRPLDARSDIFSFGAVLYEVVAGVRPFHRPTDLETLHAVMQGDFPPLPESVPAPVRSIVEKALEKDAADRYHTARDLVVDMRRVVRQSESAPTRSVDARPAPQRPSTRRSWTIGAAAAVIGVLAIGAAVLWRASRTGAPDNPLAGATFTRLADADGTESDAAISPDGKFVVFISHRSGRNDAWLSQVSTGEALNLTKGEVEIRRTPIRNMGFSADGSEVWIRSSPDAPSILMPLAGGHSRPFLRAGDADAAWSWDGSRLVVHGSVNGDPIFVAESTGANPRQIFVDRADVHNHFPIWSADGRWIYFVHGVQVTNEMDLWRIPSGGGPLERMTHHDSDVRYPTWLDAHTILYVSPDQDGSGPWLWALDTDRRTTRRVSVGLEKYTSIAGDARGDRLVATVANPTASLWSVPILDRMVEESDVRPYPVGTVRAFAPRFGGEALFYLSSHGAGDGLWKDVRGQANELWRGADTALLTPPAVSSDGSRVAIVVRQNAKLRLNVTDAGSSGFRTIAESIDIRGTAGWSPDQKWIVAGGIDEQGPALFKVPADGNSAPVRLAVGTARDPIWSPSGDLIVYTGDSVGGQSPLVGVRPDGTRVDLPRVTVAPGGERYRFTPDGRAVVYMVGAVEQDFWELDLTTKRNRQLARLGKSDAMRTFDVTPDGKTIVFDRLRENSDVVRIDLPKK